MAGNLEFNANLDIFGSIQLTTVPNQIGTVLTYNASTKLVGFRSNSDLLNDLGLTSVIANSHTHTNKTVLDGITSTLVSNWNLAYSSIGLPLTNLNTTNKSSIVAAINEINTNSSTNYIPYVGAVQSININTQTFTTGGVFEHLYTSYTRNYLGSNNGTTSTHYRKLENIASLSRGSDGTTIGDIIITIPIRTSTRWSMVVDISNQSIESKIIISGYSTNNSNRKVTVLSGFGFITEVKFGRNTNTDTVLILKRSSGTSTFTYGKVNISEFYHHVTYHADLADSTKYKVEFIDESTIVDFTLTATVLEPAFESDFKRFGLGVTTSVNKNPDAFDTLESGMYGVSTGAVGNPISGSSGTFLQMRSAASGNQYWSQLYISSNASTIPRAFISHGNTSRFADWSELWHNKNLIDPATQTWVLSQGYAVGNLANYLPLAGGTMTGTINSDVTSVISSFSVTRMSVNNQSTGIGGNAGTTSSTQGIFLRPANGSLDSTNQVIIGGNGTIYTTNHGHSGQWNHEVYGLGLQGGSLNIASITDPSITYSRIFRSTQSGHNGGIISLPYDGSGAGARTNLFRVFNGNAYISSTLITSGQTPVWLEMIHTGNIANYVPANGTYWTTNTTQTGLSGDKTTSGILNLTGANATALNVGRNNSSQNVSMSFTNSNNISHYIGLATENSFAISPNANLQQISTNWFTVTNGATSDNGVKILPHGGTNLVARDTGGYSIDTSTNSSRAEMIVRHKWSANNLTFALGGVSSATSGLMATWGMFRWLNDRTANGHDGFFGWNGDADQLSGSSFVGIGERLIYATASGLLLNRPITDFALASQIPTVGNGTLTLATSADLTGSATFSANQSTNNTFTVGLTSATLTKINNGSTAFTWGNHNSMGYLTSASLNGYATQLWVQSQGYLTSANLDNYVTTNTPQQILVKKQWTTAQTDYNIGSFRHLRNVASYVNNAGSQTATNYYLIDLGNPLAGTMWEAEIEFYNYSSSTGTNALGSRCMVFRITAYNSSSGSSLVNKSVTQLSGDSSYMESITYFRTATNNIVIGLKLSSDGSYPKIYLKKLTLHHSPSDAIENAVYNNANITMSTNISALTSVLVVPNVNFIKSWDNSNLDPSIYLEKASLALSPLANWDTLAENRIVHSTSGANSPFSQFGIGINLYGGSTTYRGQLFLNQLTNGTLQFRTANATGWSAVKTVWDDSNFNPNSYLPLAGGTMNANATINWATAGQLAVEGNNRLRFTGTQTVLSGLVSSGQGIYFRPQGDTVTSSQVSIQYDGQINTPLHGNSSQWRYEDYGLGRYVNLGNIGTTGLDTTANNTGFYLVSGIDTNIVGTTNAKLLNFGNSSNSVIQGQLVMSHGSNNRLAFRGTQSNTFSEILHSDNYTTYVNTLLGNYLPLNSNQTGVAGGISTDVNLQTNSIVYAGSSAPNRPGNNNATIFSMRGLTNYGGQIATRLGLWWLRNQENGVYGDWEIVATRVWADGKFALSSSIVPDAITTISRNGVNIPIVSQNVNIPLFDTAGAGLVPARVGATTTRFLREDGTWVVPTNTTYTAGTLAILNTGTSATNQLWSSLVLNQWINSKFTNNTFKEWNANVLQGSWSRILLASTSYSGVSGESYILNLRYTRGSFVVNYSFIITCTHAGGADAGTITQISGNKYSKFKIRIVSNGYADHYIELFDDVDSGQGITNFDYRCSVTPLTGGLSLTQYTTFVDGTNVPNGWHVDMEFETVYRGVVTETFKTPNHGSSVEWYQGYLNSQSALNLNWDQVLANSPNYQTNLTPMLYGANPYKLVLRSRGLIGDNYFSFQDVNGSETAYQGFGSGGNEDYTFFLRNNGINKFQFFIDGWIMDMTSVGVNIHRNLVIDNGSRIYTGLDGNSSNWKEAWDWGDHRQYNWNGSQQYLGGNYVSGGQQKPNYFEGGKLKLQMLQANTNIGAGSTWNWSDVLWMSSYSGGDVKLSTAIISDKYSQKIGFAKQNFDATSWGTVYEFLTTANFANGSTSQYIRGDGSLATLPVYTAGNGLTLSGTQFSLPITLSGSGTFVQSVTQTTNGLTVTMGTPTGTVYTAGNGLTLSGNTFSLPVSQSGSGNAVTSVVANANGITVTKGLSFVTFADLGNYANTDGSNTIGGTWNIDNLISDYLGTQTGLKDVMRTDATNGNITWGNRNLLRHDFLSSTSMTGLMHYSDQAGFSERVFTGHNLKFSTGLTYNPATGFLTATGGTYFAGTGLTLSGNTFSLPVTISGAGNTIIGLTTNTNGLTATAGNRVSAVALTTTGVTGMSVTGSNSYTVTTSGTFQLSLDSGYRLVNQADSDVLALVGRIGTAANYSTSTTSINVSASDGVKQIRRVYYSGMPCNTITIRDDNPSLGDKIIVHGIQCDVRISKTVLNTLQPIYSPVQNATVTTFVPMMVCLANGKNIMTFVFTDMGWVVESFNAYGGA